jgi:hypothetical protein
MVTHHTIQATAQRELRAAPCYSNHTRRSHELTALGHIGRFVHISTSISVSRALHFHTLCCTLVDSGPGIKPEHLDHLFKAFHDQGRRHGTGPGHFALNHRSAWWIHSSRQLIGPWRRRPSQVHFLGHQDVVVAVICPGLPQAICISAQRFHITANRGLTGARARMYRPRPSR